MTQLSDPAAAQPERQPNRPAVRRPPENVQAHIDLPYVDQGHERQKLDLYLPQTESQKPLPVILWIHGGGWQNGSKSGCPPLRAGYVQQGYAVASIGYRLSGDAVFPAQIEDCKAAVRWLRANAQKYRLDPNRFGVWGSSAGGHLAALVGSTGEAKAFEVGAHLDQPSRVQAVVDYYGPTDFAQFVQTPGYQRHASADSPESKLLGAEVLKSPEKAARVNPITYVDADDPPYLIVHGDKDGTVPLNQSESLYQALKKAGVSVHFHTIVGAGHGGPGFNAPEVEKLAAEFFDAILKAPQAPTSGKGEAKTSTSKTDDAAQPKAKGPAAGAQPDRRPPFALILQREDADGDGKISRQEFKGPAPLFQRWDKNQDGFLTREDFSP